MQSPINIYDESELTRLILKDQTTSGIAAVVHHMYKYKYVYNMGGWYEFMNHRWVEIETVVSLEKKIGNEVVNEYLKRITYYNQNAYESQEHKDQYLQIGKNLTDATYKLRDNKIEIVEECKYLFNNSHFINKFDSNPDLLGFDNGVYDLKSGEFREGRPEDCVSKTTGYDYNTEHTPETTDAINEFMARIFPDTEVRDYVFTLLASFLDGHPDQKCYIWVGAGGNGKSTLLELFESAIGGYAVRIPGVTLTQETHMTPNQSNPEITRLKGSRIVSTQELEKFNINTLRNWTSGDRMVGRNLYNPQNDFKPQFKLVCCCNSLPSLSPYDEGVWRRIRVLEFRSRFVDQPDPNNNQYEFKEDCHLTKKLGVWKGAFMFMLLEHYKIYKENGIHEPKQILDATTEYHLKQTIRSKSDDSDDESDDSDSDSISDECDDDSDSDSDVISDGEYDAEMLFVDWWKRSNKLCRADMKSFLEKDVAILEKEHNGKHI
jgi:P4 family phage/plasmid primase-like protien